MEVKFTNRYYRTLAKFLRKHPEYISLVEKRVLLLTNTPNHPSLRLHKLNNLENEYTISIDQSIRIIFFREKDTCYLLDIGSHDEVY